jgi:hypothetical protein
VIVIVPPDGGTVEELALSVMFAGPLTVIRSVVDFAPTRAVTVASRFVVSCTWASPLASVVATVADKVPASVENVTGVLISLFPAASSTEAMSVTVPPLAGTDVELALSTTLSVAAPPTVIRTALLLFVADGVVVPVPPPLPSPLLGGGVVVLLVPPDVAITSARPETSPAMNVVTA